MNYYFITGSSRGLGKALAEYFLMQDNSHVTGIARSRSIEHANYKHWNLDLSNLTETERFLQIAFKKLESPERIVLINNAGMLGDISYVGEQKTDTLTQIFNLNITTPALLTNHFLKKYQNAPCPKIIINVSSGAGRKTYDGWAGYCATKSALDMFSQVIAQEQQMRNSNTKIFSIAPGVVDTEMQTQIRETSHKFNFSKFERFLDLKNDNLLSNPTEIAKKIASVVENPESFTDTLLDVREF